MPTLVNYECEFYSNGTYNIFINASFIYIYGFGFIRSVTLHDMQYLAVFNDGRTLKELCTSVSSRSITTQIFPWS